MNQSIKGYGITSDGRRVDIESPEFNMSEMVSVTIIETMSKDAAKELYPDHPALA